MATLIPHVKVIWDNGLDYTMPFTKGVKTPEITFGGSDVFKYLWTSEKSEDEAGLRGELGAMSAQSFYDSTIRFPGNTITVVQNSKLWAYVRIKITHAEGNIIDRTIMDTFTLAANVHGQLDVTLVSGSQNRDMDIKANSSFSFWTGADGLLKHLAEQARDVTGTHVPLESLYQLRQYFFPGGHRFAFRSVAFSNYQDLTARIEDKETKKYKRFAGKVLWNDKDPPSEQEKVLIKGILAAYIKSEGYIKVETAPNESEEAGGHVYFGSTSPKTVDSVDSSWSGGFRALGYFRKMVANSKCQGFSTGDGLGENEV